MTEIHCDEYMTAVLNVKNMCEQPATTVTMLQTAVNTLMTASTQINNDIDTMAVPVTMEHLHKFMMVTVTKMRNIDLQHAVNNLIVCRQNYIDTYSQTHTYEETVAYSMENIAVKNYVATLEENCNCMKFRKNIINSKK